MASEASEFFVQKSILKWSGIPLKSRATTTFLKKCVFSPQLNTAMEIQRTSQKKKKRSQIFFKLGKFPQESRGVFLLESIGIDSSFWSSSEFPHSGLYPYHLCKQKTNQVGVKPKSSYRNISHGSVRSWILKELRVQAAMGSLSYGSSSSLSVRMPSAPLLPLK